MGKSVALRAEENALHLPYMKALFLYSDATGQGKMLAHVGDVISRLRKTFSQLEAVQTHSQDELIARAKGACGGKVDALIVAGGDGTFHHVVNALMDEEKTPILGYINAGTICDIGKNFGIQGSYENALDIIERGYTTYFDVGKINDQYFTYVSAVGAYSDIAYIAPRDRKKRLGAVAYYTIAVGESLKPTKVIADIEADGKQYHIKTPFILLLNGSHVGGFHVNQRLASISDGKMELYLTKPGFFNGLIHYLFFKMRTLKISASHFKIHTNIDMPWCLDGEEGPKGDVEISVISKKLMIYAKPPKRFFHHG